MVCVRVCWLGVPPMAFGGLGGTPAKIVNIFCYHVSMDTTAITRIQLCKIAFYYARWIRVVNAYEKISQERCSVSEYFVSFMTEFHEVKCPDQIGRVSGCGLISIGGVLEFPQVGENSLRLL